MYGTEIRALSIPSGLMSKEPSVICLYCNLMPTFLPVLFGHLFPTFIILWSSHQSRRYWVFYLQNRFFFSPQNSFQIDFLFFGAFTHARFVERDAEKQRSQKSGVGNHKVPSGGLCSECSWKSQVHCRKKRVNKREVNFIFFNILVF